MQASTFNVTLDQGRLELNALVQTLQCTGGVTAKICESGLHVESQSLKFAEITNLKRLVKSSRGLLVAVAGLLGHGNQTLAQQTLARVVAQLNGLLQALRKRLGAEALQIVGNESGTRQLLGAGLENSLALLLGNLLKETLKSVAADIVGEPINDAASSEVEKSLAELAQVLIGNSSPVQSLHILAVHRDSGTGILHNLFPLGQNIVASGAVRVEDRVGLADDGLSIQLDGAVVVLGAVGLVTGGLQLGGVFLPSLPGIG